MSKLKIQRDGFPITFTLHGKEADEAFEEFHNAVKNRESHFFFSCNGEVKSLKISDVSELSYEAGDE